MVLPETFTPTLEIEVSPSELLSFSKPSEHADVLLGVMERYMLFDTTGCEMTPELQVLVQAVAGFSTARPSEHQLHVCDPDTAAWRNVEVPAHPGTDSFLFCASPLSPERIALVLQLTDESVQAMEYSNPYSELEMTRHVASCGTLPFVLGRHYRDG